MVFLLACVHRVLAFQKGKEMLPFKLPVRISGYAGQHDEAGARIVDADGKYVCSTPHVEHFHDPASWTEYHKKAEIIVECINAHAEKVVGN